MWSTNNLKIPVKLILVDPAALADSAAAFAAPKAP
jgi:hypothetical protein